MRLPRFILTLSTLFAASIIIQAASIKRRDDAPTTKCNVFKNEGDNNIYWQPVGDLMQGGLVNNVMAKWDDLKVHITGRRVTAYHTNPSHDRTYTFRAGGTYNQDTHKGTIDLACERFSKGGWGQQFQINFYRKIGDTNSAVASYWINPNEHCTLEVGFDPTLITTFSIQHRDWYY